MNGKSKVFWIIAFSMLSTLLMAQHNNSTGNFSITISGVEKAGIDEAMVLIYSEAYDIENSEIPKAMGFGLRSKDTISFPLLEFDLNFFIEESNQFDGLEENSENFKRVKEVMERSLNGFTEPGSYVILLLTTDEDMYIYTDGQSAEELEDRMESLAELDEEEVFKEIFPKCDLSGDTTIKFSKFISEF